MPGVPADTNASVTHKNGLHFAHNTPICVGICPNWYLHFEIKIININMAKLLPFISNDKSSAALFKIILILFKDK